MKKRRLSILGFLMEQLNIQTVSLSRELHVDASLVSKWKSGDRALNSNSVYFEEIIAYLISESEKSKHRILRDAISQVYPMENINEEESWASVLRQLLSGSSLSSASIDHSPKAFAGIPTPIHTFAKNEGRRKAVGQLLDYAEQLPSPGQFIFIDSEEYKWLLEDIAFSKAFVKRMNALLGKGFTAQFVIHFSAYRERFVQFFEICSLLLFHRNASWYYYEYYDENALRSSIFSLEKAVSLLGLSAAENESFTMLFSDTPSVVEHVTLASSIIGKCEKLFINFPPDKCKDVVEYIRVIRKRGAIYAYLPAPAFVSSNMELLWEILSDNEIEPELIEHCLQVNRSMRDMVHSQFSGLLDLPERIIQIFQLEKMERGFLSSSVESLSLTLLGGKQVKVSREQYAKCLRDLVVSLQKHENFEIVFLSEADSVSLPNIDEINCWCKQNTWMVQMDQDGFRLSDEVSIVNAASITFERCLRKIPPERKEKDSVIKLLNTMAEKLEQM